MKKKTVKSTHAKRPDLFKQVYAVVAQIPPGKVTTYGALAKILGTRDPRKIGWALHANKDENVPCHRVVNKEGGVAPNFAFDGWKEQKRRLLAEGVNFVSEMQVDLKKHLWNG